MKNKLVFFILFLILILMINLELRNIKEVNYHNKIIDKIYDNHNYIKNNYKGYIEIPKYNIKRLIKNEPSSLNKNYAYMMNNSLDDEKIIIAGHNIKIVFRNLHLLKNDDLIYIKDNNHDYFNNMF